MEFPVNLKYTYHKHGGNITRITSIGHGEDKPQDGRSRDYWFFVGEVKWNDGTKSKGIEIAPWAVCYHDEEKKNEVLELMAELNDYLAKHGKWYRGSKSGHEGWYATRSKKRRAA